MLRLFGIIGMQIQPESAEADEIEKNLGRGGGLR